MTEPVLARELLALDYKARVRRLVQIGQQSRTAPDVKALLARWERGDWQQRQWALLACWGSRDAQRAARMATGASRSLANLAISLLAYLGDDDQVVQVLHALPQDLHRDVRIALLRALWDHLERPAAWNILNDAAATPDGRLLTGVLRIPGDKLSAPARERLIHLLIDLVQHREITVRLAVLQRFAQMPVPDPGRRLLEQSIALLASPFPDERAAAGQATVALLIPDDAEVTSAAVRRLLPQRRCLVDWLTVFTAAARNLPRLATVARAVLRVVESDPLLLRWQATLAVTLDGFAGLRAVIERTQADDTLHADALATLEHIIQEMASRPDWRELEPLELDLAASPDARQRRLALTALSAVAQQLGWTPPYQARLERYRADSAALVAGTAQFLFLPGE